MKKFFLLFIVLLSVFLYFFLNPLVVHFAQKAMKKSIKAEAKITSLILYPLELDATLYFPEIPEGIKVHAEYVAGPSIKPKSIGKIIITSTSLGGLVTIVYEYYRYNIDVKDVDLKKVALLLHDEKKMVLAGLVNGTMTYHKKKKTGSTDLIATEVVLDIPDIDNTVSSINDALDFNVVNLFSRNIGSKEKKQTPTEVEHVQFNIDYDNKLVTSKDIAIKTINYRIALDAKLYTKGNIDYFYIYLLDKNGCAIVTHELQGTLKGSKRKTSTAIKNVMKSSPKSMFSMGQQMMQYGSTYAERQTGFPGPSKQMTSYMLKESDYMFNNVSQIVLPNDCKRIYEGKVTHPEYKKKELKKDSTSYRQELLL